MQEPLPVVLVNCELCEAESPAEINQKYQCVFVRCYLY